MIASGGVNYPERMTAHTPSVAPADLLDVQLPSGEVCYWASRKITAPSVIVADGGTASNVYQPWLLQAPKFTLHRSMDADMGKFVIQNATGDSMSRDFQRLVASRAIEGAAFVYRLWQAAAEYPWIEIHGTLSLGDIDVTADVDAKQLLNPNSDDTPMYSCGEICPYEYGSDACGATDPTPCNNTFSTCRVPERPLIVLHTYEKPYDQTVATVSTRYVDRRRRF